METILGANGVIARELSRQLPQYSDRIRQVSRSPKPVNATDELFPADLLDARATADAIAGGEVTYLVAGLKYEQMGQGLQLRLSARHPSKYLVGERLGNLQRRRLDGL